jgi:hypothetical protein
MLLASCRGTAESQPAAKPSAATTASGPVSPRPARTATITGFGALVADWKTAHTADHDFAAGSVYDPDSALPSINGHTGAIYVLVTPQNGRILSYAMNLRNGTPLGAAITAAQHQFPPDARILWTARKGMCVQTQFASHILGKSLAAPAIGDPGGLAMVEFEDLDSSGNDIAAPRAFNSASFDLGGSTSPGGSPGC